MTRANELQKEKTIEKHTATTQQRENQIILIESEKLYDEKIKIKVVKMAKKSIKIIFELINVYEMMIKTEGEEINVMYKKNER